ncbi:hypothetical protein [Lederbergia panacisoli]|uniref:hypothetical protein n=1 Tax=Lederbergia panacisoli TaxID=1255251 RepID=UPI00214B851E|nr:hypothetical protein [Lederbergia panacisoli]MCR2821547.1 hypothetical protein [Lederbergia panacisoli]
MQERNLRNLQFGSSIKQVGERIVTNTQFHSQPPIHYFYKFSIPKHFVKNIGHAKKCAID